jgi:hypothetical protein
VTKSRSGALTRPVKEEHIEAIPDRLHGYLVVQQLSTAIIAGKGHDRRLWNI